jgi:3'(2'),5'-bisphosphate nucleotidase
MVKDALAEAATAARGRPEDDALAEVFARLALDAGVEIMRVFEGDPHMRMKRDSSPVCDADLFAEEVILKGLSRLAPMPVVAEEHCAFGHVPVLNGGDFVLVDAVDGTKEFLRHSDCFTVNIALIRDGAPVAAAVYAPARRELYVAGTRARACHAEPGAALPPRQEWRELHTRAMPLHDALALKSREHQDRESDALLARLPVGRVTATGSSLKFCQIAAGEADVYPRFSRTMEWDIAAGDAVLRRAGGLVADPSGAPMVYGLAGRDFVNGPFIAWGDPAAARAYAEKRGPRLGRGG